MHSAGSPALVGNTSLSLALEQKIGEFLEMEQVVPSFFSLRAWSGGSPKASYALWPKPPQQLEK